MTATENPNIESNTGSVRFSRKVQVRPYEVAEASITIAFDIPTDPDLTPEAASEQLIANARASFFSAKALVFEELGLEFIVSEGGIVTEVLERHFGNVTEVKTTAPVQTEVSDLHAVAQEFAAPTAGGSDTPPFSPTTTDKGEKGANSKWAKERYATHPHEFFDNRPKKQTGEYKANAPDVKHKDTKIGVWLT
jgi:hypothetical protein